VVVRLSAPPFNEIRVQGKTVTAGGGARLGHVISTVVRDGLAGLEPLVGIPGTIGGALHGNAGSRGGDIGQWTCRATVMSRSSEIIERQREDLVFSYRQSSLDELVILGCQFQLEEEDPQELTKRMQKLWIVKKASQPLGHQSAGCIFKNPRGISAGMLIDQAGLKGTRVGGAEVSDRHANFIVTESDATSADVLRLIELVRSRVAERLGVELETEIEVW
ncbi:MAG TPA: UDP-N-acetylmuramate dehydrogenase, partial [Pirellulales bacterium]|nr:UDP-N-acetylmuramate dehydrogenase [Pirellulales bacterium]